MYSDYPKLPPSSRQFPKVPLERRAYAFLLDFVSIWLLSSFFPGLAQGLVFIVSWLGLRVILVERNKGQSFGSWAFDLKVIDAKFNKIPGIAELAKREGILGGAALLAMIGLNINFRNALSMLLLTAPLLIDCGIALGDEELNQAFHDRIAQTLIIQARRGFSLDLRLKKGWFALKRNWQTRQRDRDYRD